MAVIKKFDQSKVDYESLISKKYNSRNYADCIKTIRYVLDNLDADVDIDILGVYLVKCYYNLGLYEEAFYEIKILIALGVNNSELSVLAMEAIQCLGRLNAHKYFNYTNFDFVNDSFSDDTEEEVFLNSANSSEEDIFYRKKNVSKCVVQELENNDAPDTFLSLVGKEDTDGRLFEKFYNLIREVKYQQAIEMLEAALTKYPNDYKYLEQLSIVYNLAHNVQKSKETALIIMKNNPNSAVALHIYLDVCVGNNAEIDWNIANEFALNFRAKKEFDIHFFISTIIKFFDDLDIVQKVIDNNQDFYYSMYVIYAQAQVAYLQNNKAKAISILKNMRAMFGDRSFANDYIEMINADKFEINYACKVPRDIAIKSTVNIDLLLRDKSINFSKALQENPRIFKDIKKLIYADELDIVRRALSKFAKINVIEFKWQLQEMVLDNQRVSEEMRQLLLALIISKDKHEEVWVSGEDVLENIDVDSYMSLVKGDTVMKKAVAIVLSRIFYSQTALTIALEPAIQKAKKFKDKKKIENYKFMAELILNECWYFGLSVDLNEVEAKCGMKTQLIKKLINEFRGETKERTGNDKPDGGYTFETPFEAPLEELMDNFTAFMEKITSDINYEGKIKVVKYKGEKVKQDDGESQD